jgi:RNA-binding protein
MPAKPASLNGRQVRHLRALAHHLDPVVQIGKEGMTESVVAAVGQALLDHELIKVRLPQIEKDERQALSALLVAATTSQSVGELGRVVILYRRHPHQPKVVLPSGRA